MDNREIISNEQINQNIQEIAYNSTKLIEQCAKIQVFKYISSMVCLLPRRKNDRNSGKIADVYSIWADGFDYNNPQRCGITASAIFTQNMFNQKHIAQLNTYEEFSQGLQDAEPGLFWLTLPSLDHTLILIKTFENGETGYQVVQSYIGQYTLAEFLENYSKEFKYKNYKELNDLFLQPLATILFDIEGEKNIYEKIETKREAYKKLTKITSSSRKIYLCLFIFTIPKSDFIPFHPYALNILRSTNVHQKYNENVDLKLTLIHACGTAAAIGTAAIVAYGKVISASPRHSFSKYP